MQNVATVTSSSYNEESSVITPLDERISARLDECLVDIICEGYPYEVAIRMIQHHMFQRDIELECEISMPANVKRLVGLQFPQRS